ncbi:MAG TPA: hypothetical protein GXZ86_02240 [Clostridiales bacterium]|jgi:hypothetical protein|nr:hypothetical protein [Clostridiales bacterium]
MAKYTRQLTGDFQTLLQSIEQGILGGSVSASLEDSADYQTGDVRVAVRVFERYSWLGSNRLSLSVTLVGQGDRLFITGITSGGSQAVFFKINTFGEAAFLDRFREIVDGF